MDATVSAAFGFLDYSVLLLVLCISLGIGIYFGYFDASAKTTDEYLLGGRNMKTIPIAISLIASQLSAATIISMPADLYAFGSVYYIMLGPLVILVTLFINYAILPIFYQTNIDNCYSYLELRFDRKVCDLITISFVLSGLFMLPILAYTPALAFAQVTGQNIHVVNTIVTTVCVLYTMMGGIKAVVWSDVAQAFVMVVSTVVTATVAVTRVGGLPEVFSRAIHGGRLTVPSFQLDLTTRQTFWNFTFGYFIIWVGHVGFNQSSVQRMVSLPSLGHAQRTMIIFCGGVLFIQLLGGLNALAMFAYYHECDPHKAGRIQKVDQIVPYFVAELFDNVPGMSGVFISSVFCASLSTISAYMNSIAGVIYKQFVCRIGSFKHSETKANQIMKSMVVVAGVYSVLAGFLVEKNGSLYQTMTTMSSLTKGAIFGVFTLGFFYPKVHSRAAFYGTLLSMVILGSIVLRAQVYRTSLSISYEPLPTSIEGCATNETIYATASSVTAAPTPEQDHPVIYMISFLWNSVIGTLIVWIVGVILTKFTKPPHPDYVANKILVSPIVHFMLPKTQSHVQMKTLNTNNSTDCETKYVPTK